MDLLVTTAPKDEPVLLSEMKNYLRVDHTDEDDTIRGIISAARQYAEDFTKRKFLTTVFTGTMDSFPDPGEVIEFPMPPLASVASIKYIDLSGVQQTWSSDDYVVDTAPDRGIVYPDYNEVYPSVRGQRKAVEITFTAGYGTPDIVPEGLKQAIKIIGATLYEQRESVVVGLTAMEIPFSAQNLLVPFTSWKF